jgi:hypothetical protein
VNGTVFLLCPLKVYTAIVKLIILERDVNQGTRTPQPRLDESHADQLQPERIRALSLRQWRAARLGLLLRPDGFNPIPVPPELAVSGLIHIDADRATQARQSYQDAPGLLNGLPLRAAENIFDKRKGILT